MRWPARATFPTGWAILVAAWMIAACGGGGGGSPTSPPPPPPPPPSAITFTADAAAGPNSIFLAAGQSGAATVLLLEVRARDVVDLYSLNLTLEFPSAILGFRKAATSEGIFLSEDGAFDTELVVENDPDGTLVIGHSRLGTAPGVSGSGTLFSLEFDSRASGSGSLDLSRHDVLDSLGVVQPNVTFIGGSVNVRLN